MHKFILLISFLLIGFGCNSVEKLPQNFLGTWKVNCSDSDDLFVLNVTSQQFQFWETIGDIQKIKQISPGVYDINLNLFSEGQQWNASMQYKVVGDKLIQLASGELNEITRFRCTNV